MEFLKSPPDKKRPGLQRPTATDYPVCKETLRALYSYVALKHPDIHCCVGQHVFAAPAAAMASCLPVSKLFYSLRQVL